MKTNDHENERTDDELFAAAEAGARDQGDLIEAMGRLRTSIDGLQSSNDRYSFLLLCVISVLMILTATLVYVALSA